MKPLIIFLTSASPDVSFPAWRSVWCAPHAAVDAGSDAHDIYRLPDKTISRPCQGLLAAESYSRQLPLAITTGLMPEFIADIRQLPSTPHHFLIEPDCGLLWFPKAYQFRQCVLQALRFRSPEREAITLLNVWQQWQLHCLDKD